MSQINVKVEPPFDAVADFDRESYDEAYSGIIESVYQLVRSGASSENVEDVVAEAIGDAILFAPSVRHRPPQRASRAS